MRVIHRTLTVKDGEFILTTVGNLFPVYYASSILRCPLIHCGSMNLLLQLAVICVAIACRTEHIFPQSRLLLINVTKFSLIIRTL